MPRGRGHGAERKEGSVWRAPEGCGQASTPRARAACSLQERECSLLVSTKSSFLGDQLFPLVSLPAFKLTSPRKPSFTPKAEL